MSKVYDYLIIGGGIVGSSLAYGLSKEKSLSIAMVDAYDNTHRASVGNYGLTWLQSKGYLSPNYAQMSERALLAWPEFRDEIERKSKIDVEFEQRGGLHFCFSKEEYDARAKKIENINSYYENNFSKTLMLDKKQTKILYPKVGKDVIGASYNKFDGYLNPAKLWYAQLKLSLSQGVHYVNNFNAVTISRSHGEYHVSSQNAQSIRAKRLILSAGLGSKDLALQLGIEIPIKPEKGHILVTQKVHNLELIPSLNIRQAKDGALLLGYSNEECGFDENINEGVVQHIIQKAIRIMPEIKDLQILRSWASLRIMPKDGKSIYESIDDSLHVISTHSAITFAPLHVKELSQAILEGEMPKNLEEFSLKRFEKEI